MGLFCGDGVLVDLFVFGLFVGVCLLFLFGLFVG